jgi:hypothetical protein
MRDFLNFSSLIKWDADPIKMSNNKPRGWITYFIWMVIVMVLEKINLAYIYENPLRYWDIPKVNECFSVFSLISILTVIQVVQVLDSQRKK